jgi:D-glycero-alpha-D-manno-heptose-7-phosphate kinase
VQDQYIAAYGDIRFFEFQKDGTVRVERLEMEEAQKRRLVSNLLLFYTNRTRQSAAILSEQRRNIESRGAELRQLRDMAYQARELVLKGEFDRVGEMLGQSWEQKKKLASNITSPEIDRMYKSAVKAGALGGKISGAGAGGFLLLYCSRERQDAVRQAMRRYRELPIELSRDGSKVVFNIRRYGW